MRGLSGWAVDQYTTKSWIFWAVLMAAFAVSGARDGLVAFAVVAAAFAVVCTVQAVRSRSLAKAPREIGSGGGE